MICQQCKKNEATYYTISLKHVKREYMPLCESCHRNERTGSMTPSSSIIKAPPKKKILLDSLGRNLNQLALEGKIDPVIGRNSEIEQVIEMLNRRFKNNPVLIGEAGVGKTAIAEGLAMKIVEGTVPEKLRNKSIYALEVNSLVSGTSYRGQFEERMKKILQELKDRKDIILFIDELHLIVGAGAVQGSMDASNILKPALARSEIQLMGATTLKEYRHIEKDAALERRLGPIQVLEPNEEDCFVILKGIRSKYENFHQTSFSDEILRACISLSVKFIPDRFLPDKAIDLLDILGSKTNLSHKEQREKNSLVTKIKFFESLKEKAIEFKRYDDSALYEERLISLYQELEQCKRQATLDDLLLIIEKKTGIPISVLQTEERQKISNLHNALSNKVIGQPIAVEKVAQAIKRSKTGLKPKKRPIASFLFSGPTGVGKTELTKVLAEELFGNQDALIRLDMSEYMEKHSVSKLIGSPPGYVGYADAGQLTEKLRRTPYSILLLDEIEKAHPDVQNIFLQILDDGHVTDSQGKRVYFQNTIIIATTNAGCHVKKEHSIGFSTFQIKEKNTTEDLKEHFKPEFLNRFDSIIPFRFLEEEDVVQIIDLLIMELQKQLIEQNVILSIEQDAKLWIAKEGYNRSFGARPLRRAIQEYLENPIADVLLHSPNVSRIFIAMSNNQLIFRFES